MTKTCIDCKEVKPTTEFYRVRGQKDGFHPYCKPCDKLRATKWAKENPDKVSLINKNMYKRNSEYYRKRQRDGRKANPDKYRNYDLKKKYGITLQEKMDLLAKQSNKCAACSSPEHKAKYPGLSGWHVDHCHETKVVRGIWCHECNTALGLLHDSLERIQNLYQYLSTFSSTTN